MYAGSSGIRTSRRDPFVLKNVSIHNFGDNTDNKEFRAITTCSICHNVC